MKNLLIQLIVLLTFLIAFFVRFSTFSMPANYLVALLVGLLVSTVVMPATGAFRYELRWSLFRKTRRLIAGWAIVVTTLITLAALFKVTSDYSRVWFTYWTLLGGFGIFVGQLSEHAWLNHKKKVFRSSRKIVLIAGGENGRRVEKHLKSNIDSEFDLVALFGSDFSQGPMLPIDDLPDYLSTEQIKEVWIAVPWEDRQLLESTLNILSSSVVDIKVIPDVHQYRLLNQNIVNWDGLAVINLSSTPMTSSELRLKAWFDRIGALFLLIVLFPLLAAIALLVKLSSDGPVLFRQTRHGLDGEKIEILKFRSMKNHTSHAGEVVQAQENDCRITAIGRLLRRSSLDELPQLVNVLRGEMSLVGPRPHAIEHNNGYKSRIPKYMLRHKVLPGITGWAQIHGFRGITDTDDKMALRIEHDLWYIQNWSLWLDLKILLQTPLAMIHRNAF